MTAEIKRKDTRSLKNDAKTMQRRPKRKGRKEKDVGHDSKWSIDNVQSLRQRQNKQATEQRAPQRRKAAKSQIFKPGAINN